MGDTKNVIVLGAGVIGLTTALKIQEQGGYQVTIIAEILPEDTKSIRYTSHWAGAHHVLNITETEKQQSMDLDTFDVMWKLSEPGNPAEELFLRIKQTEYFCDKKFVPPLERMPDHEILAQDSLPPRVVHGATFSTVTIDTPRYLHYLAAHFTSSGGHIHRGAVQHISQVVEGSFSGDRAVPKPPHAVVVCTGIGTRFLGGVEDKTMYPIRGQTVLVRAPWIKEGRTFASEDGTLAYIIPRRSGDIILGGTKEVDDWFPLPRPETTRDILERTFAIFPELAPPEIRATRAPTVEDVLPLVIEEGCGLRPARKDGIRLEVEWFTAGADVPKVPVVYNYGHGGYGYQSSWGAANITLKLLEGALNGA